MHLLALHRGGRAAGCRFPGDVLEVGAVTVNGTPSMPIRDPVFDPPFAIVRASHVELGVRDLARSRAFYVDCLGLLVSDETEDALYLRGVEERNHHSIVLRRARPAAKPYIRQAIKREAALVVAVKTVASRLRRVCQQRLVLRLLRFPDHRGAGSVAGEARSEEVAEQRELAGPECEDGY